MKLSPQFEFNRYVSMWVANVCSTKSNHADNKSMDARMELTVSELKNEDSCDCFDSEVARLLRLDGRDIERLYPRWLALYDDPSVENVRCLAERIDRHGNYPLISVVMPVYNTNVEHLERAIESVRRQLYPFWELCIVDDASTDPGVIDVLKRQASIDRRIRVILRSANSGISEATNEALGIASGEWVCFLDHDDEMHLLGLARLVVCIGDNPGARLIYTDEDKISEGGERCLPHFKPDFNYDLLLSQNYLCHLVCVKKDLVISVGGLRSDFDGAQDYDLILRLIEVLECSEIVHLAQICYHWRVSRQSTASSVDAKPESLNRSVRAIEEHLQRRKVAATVSNEGVYCRVKYALPEDPPLVSIVVPTKNKRGLIEKCVRSIFERTVYPKIELIVVDNGSNEPDVSEFYSEACELYGSKFKLLNLPIAFNFSKLVNAGVAASDGEYVVLLNNDTEVIEPAWLEELVSVAIQPNVGAVGAKLLYSNNLVQHAGVVLGIGGVAGHVHKFLVSTDGGYFGRAKLLQSISAVTGACFAVNKSIWNELNGFDERLTVAFNDVDFCIRLLKSGYRNVFNPYALLYHHESISRGYEDTPEKISRFNSEVRFMTESWGDILVDDKCFNPNLSLNSENYELAFPPRVKMGLCN